MKLDYLVVNLLISLLRSALSDYTISNPPTDINVLWATYKLAKFHSVEAAAYFGIEKNHIQLSDELQKEWSNAQIISVAKTVVEAYEKEKIYNLFSKNGIVFLPLKGLLMKEMYPAPELRQMADFDILIQKEQVNQAEDLLLENGYHCAQKGQGHHDSFAKPPYITIELHHEMVDKTMFVFHEYYKDIWSKTRVVNGSEYIRELSKSDFYIFMLVHFAKHYYRGGSGIRSIMDLYVFLEKYKYALDEEYLTAELEKLDLTEFRNEAENLAISWFTGADLTDSSKMADYVLTSGSYGTKEHILEKRVYESSVEGKINRFLYVRKRLFPNRHFMAFYYPIVEEKPYLLPIFWTKRIFLKWRKGIHEIKYIRSKK